MGGGGHLPAAAHAQGSLAVMTASELVPWHTWGAAAFKAAQDQDKPILLDIGAVWCHWCHVMDQTTYADPEVVALIKEHFVPIKVDTDRRPDVNLRYNQGGWPTTAFLAPTGELLVGFTYLPPETMVQVLRQIHDQWEANASNIKGRLAALQEERRGRREAPRPGQRIRQSFVQDVLASLRSEFDPAYGGFGRGQKFPHPEAVRLLLDQASVRHQGDLLAMARKTLDGMLGLYDEVHGGFYRYSVDREWREPHYEKMAEVNAGAIENFVQLYQATGEGKYLEAVAGTIGYLRGRLYQPEQGYFGASQDADVGSHDPEQRYVTGEVYFELDAGGRAQYAEPYVDSTLYADTNARLACALLRAYAVTGEAEWAQLGKAALDNTWDALHKPEGGVYHFLDGDETRVYGLLADQALMLRAVLDAYEILGESRYLDRARQLAAFMEEALADGQSGGFYDQPAEGEDRYGALDVRVKSLTDNAVAAQGLLRLHHLTGEQDYRRAVGRTLEYFAPEYSRMGLFAAGYATAVDHYLREPAHVVIVDGQDGRSAHALLRAAGSTYAPWKVVQLLKPERDRERIAELGFPTKAEPTAYVCIGELCMIAEAPEKLKAALVGSSNDGN